MDYNSGSNGASNFKLAERIAYLVSIFSLSDTDNFLLVIMCYVVKFHWLMAFPT